MSQIYLAGPFFSEEQVERVARIEKALEENPTVTGFYSPRHHQESIMKCLVQVGHKKFMKKIWQN